MGTFPRPLSSLRTLAPRRPGQECRDFVSLSQVCPHETCGKDICKSTASINFAKMCGPLVLQPEVTWPLEHKSGENDKSQPSNGSRGTSTMYQHRLISTTLPQRIHYTNSKTPISFAFPPLQGDECFTLTDSIFALIEATFGNELLMAACASRFNRNDQVTQWKEQGMKAKTSAIGSTNSRAWKKNKTPPYSLLLLALLVLTGVSEHFCL